MDYLIDTNILIPIEPASAADLEELSEPIADLVRQIQHTGNRIVIHPATLEELGRDTDSLRRRLRRTLASMYVRLENPPEPRDGMAAHVGQHAGSGHDAVDALLLVAVVEDAVSFLVTEDGGIHTQAARLGVSDRVLTVADARELVRTLYEKVPPAPAPIESTTCDALDPADSIFTGLRTRYVGFDGWWAKAVSQRRRAWVVRSPTGALAALCVVKEEQPGEHGLFGKLLKLCTFKVADDFPGYRYGELLMKAVFGFAEANNYGVLFVEVDPELKMLLSFLEEFGFFDSGRRKPNGDVVMVKERRPSRDVLRSLPAFEAHRRFGPPLVRTEGVSSWLIPIQPRYHSRLFPEAERQMTLMSGLEAHGNSIRKAYLCRAAVRTMRAGDLLYFYKSGQQAVSVVGIVEDIHVLSRAQDIVRAAGKRTVYTAAEIDDMAHGEKDVLVIGFRQVRVASAPVSYGDLLSHGVVIGPPQTVQSVTQEGAAWLSRQMGL